MEISAQKQEEITQLVNNPSKPQKIGDPLIDTFREKVQERSGRSGFRGLVCVLRQLDNNGDRKLSKEELSEGLRMFKMDQNPQDLDRLFRYFDRDKSGSISVTEFVRGIRPEMPPCRRDLVLQAYSLLDANCDGNVTMEDIKTLFDASHHPEVISGKRTADSVYEEFCKSWDKDGDKTVSKAEFIDYYTDISAGIDSNQYFELMIRNAWHMSGGQGVAQNTTCLRVLVTYDDGRQAVVEVKNDLGLNRRDKDAIIRRLTQQGVKGIKEIQLTG
eukprot:PhF_6_TR12261/c0_g1_i1/m.19429